MILMSVQRQWGKLGLAARLIILAGLALLAGGMAQLYMTVQNEVATVRADFAEHLEGEIQSLEILLSEQLVIGDYTTIQQILDVQVKRKDVREISLIGKRGNRLQATDKPVAMLAPAWFAAWVALPAMQGKRDIVVGGQNYGQIAVQFTEVPTINRIWQLFLMQLAIMLAGLLFFVLVTSVLIRYGLAPLRDLSRHAAALGKGDYSARISLAGTPEMQVTAKAFNDMADRIESLLASLHEREAHLHEALAEQSTILDNAVVGIAFLKDFRFAWINHKLEEMFGYTREEVAGQLTGILHASSDEYRRLGEEAYPALVRGGNYSGEYRMKRKDGSQFWCLLSGKMVDRDDLTQGSIWILHDISSRRVAEENLKCLNETLEQRVQDEAAKNREKDHLLIQQSRLAAMGEMIGNIAHQWRQPLNALAILLANIKDAYVYKELDEDYLDAATETGQTLLQKMSRTIDDFRNFFRPNREKMAFSLNKSIREAISIVDASFHNHQIKVDWQEGEDIAAYGFPSEYSQVLLNFLGNARDAILNQRQADGKVAIRLARTGDNVAVTVSDNGGGIPDDVLPKIFDPYFTTKEKGTGIGLYMSKMIIEGNMSGSIEVRNNANGAEFTVITPLAPNQSC
jgi:PAS domain S-box-containing protein